MLVCPLTTFLHVRGQFVKLTRSYFTLNFGRHNSVSWVVAGISDIFPGRIDGWPVDTWQRRRDSGTSRRGGRRQRRGCLTFWEGREGVGDGVVWIVVARFDRTGATWLGYTILKVLTCLLRISVQKWSAFDG